MFLFLFSRKNYPTNDHKIMNTIMKEMMKLDCNIDGMPIAPEENDFYALNNLHVCYSDLVVESGGDGGWDVQPYVDGLWDVV